MPTPPLAANIEIEELADWAELMAMMGGGPLSKGHLTTALAREGAVSLSAPDDAWATLETRQHLMGHRWPFDLTGMQLTAIPSHPLADCYRFLAALGLRSGVASPGPQLFEFLVAEVVGALTGRPGMRLGWPRVKPMPKRFSTAIKLYLRESKEEKAWRDLPLSADKDLGLDIVTWFPLDDPREGSLHLLGQCATGADWTEKLRELNPEKWNAHVHWCVAPARFFALPFVVRPEEIRRHSMDGGLILDRVRLLQLAERTPVSRTLKRRLVRYCDALYAAA